MLNNEKLAPLIIVYRVLNLQSLRTFEAKDAQVCLYAIHTLLSNPEFKDMVKDFSSTTAAKHWKEVNAFEAHSNCHKVLFSTIFPPILKPDFSSLTYFYIFRIKPYAVRFTF